MKFFSKLAAGFLGLSLLFGSTADAEESAKSPKIEKRIAINAASRMMAYYENGVKIAEYPLGLGKTYTPTPVGYFKIVAKEINPPWIDPNDPEYIVSSGPDNPLGYRWMQIYGNYGIHGTNRPDSIGGYVSNGCVRMREADVEQIFDAVEVGTPVDITYNRVVVEKIADGNVVYWIYPDGYGWQNIDVAYVNRWLEPYGVAPFESDASIEEKIEASDGTPTTIGKPYNIEVQGKRIEPVEVNGKKFLAKAVQRDNINYLPVVPVAMALKTKLEWRAGEATLKTKYGTVTGFESKSQIYCNAEDAIVLFNLDGGLQNISDNPTEGKVFKFYIANSKLDKKSKKDAEKIKPVDKDKPVENLTPENKPADNKPADKDADKQKTDKQSKSDKKKTDKQSKSDKKTKSDKKSKTDKKTKSDKKSTDKKIREKKIPIEEIETVEILRINHANSNDN